MQAGKDIFMIKLLPAKPETLSVTSWVPEQLLFAEMGPMLNSYCLCEAMSLLCMARVYSGNGWMDS
jgi:hypothetical protein